MKDIKFRAWHKGQNKMYPAEEMGRDELTIATDGRGFVNVSEDGPQFSEYITDMIPLQYTGMKDKNGEEIYEDDNLKIILDGGTYISPVMKRHGCWVIYHPYRLDMHTGEKDYINFGWWTSHDNVEVIGNIHEQESHT